jgi:hypothetical protein
MFADAERVQANLVGPHDRLKPPAQVTRGVNRPTRGGVEGGGHKTINANFHTLVRP